MTKRYEVSAKSLNKILNYLHSEEKERGMVSFLIDLSWDLDATLKSDLKISDNQCDFQDTLARIAVASVEFCEFFGDIANLSDAKIYDEEEE